MKSSKKKLVFIVLIVLIPVITFGIWVNYRLNLYQKDNNMSETLSPLIKSTLDSDKTLNDYPYEQGAPDWQNNYLVLMCNKNLYNIEYNSVLNEQLNTDNNYPGDQVKGVIILEPFEIEHGEYVRKSNVKTKRAIQRNYVLHYFDFETQQTIVRDTLYGDEPSSSISQTASGMFDYPTDKEITSSIKNIINQ
ncbi:hypothetical protein [Myroides odoratimimus]|uniref:hypothetical protein n=1 Tax=Myroides odoratimimus TaxID=76832 RepID=UPI003100DBB9